ncbi:MAG: Preprotein translocase, SecE subunit [Candidatus Falkowbacteria bacterium GW2011_GWF2_39_8]|uniref:Protein translocase subunit SecE n=1 Tax=Candidatus Falkowbacteria bacterium GW2011_GWF2_39_8 TaxID=1618642 RepID=A0A0G0Q8A2_9BACT|nr:MAG: Preprotein translocase, SecE subunit [Candidatus Falkowbacteria bacterium GW2011_GWF2_39_8]
MSNRLITYLKESAEELKKVTWPTKKETYNYTLLVIGVSVVVALFLGGLDFVFSKTLQTLLSKGM